jgi:hypothetical protein
MISFAIKVPPQTWLYEASINETRKGNFSSSLESSSCVSMRCLLEVVLVEVAVLVFPLLPLIKGCDISSLKLFPRRRRILLLSFPAITPIRVRWETIMSQALDTGTIVISYLRYLFGLLKMYVVLSFRLD